MHSLKSVKNAIFMYCIVTASQNVNEYKSLWIAIQSVWKLWEELKIFTF